MKLFVVFILGVCAGSGFEQWESKQVQVNDRKAITGYTVYNADSVITSNGDTVAYMHKHNWQFESQH